MEIQSVATIPFKDQRPGTSGLRKKVTEFQQPGYLENFIQALFDSLPTCLGKKLVVGGDGRYYNDQAIQTIIRLATANGWGHIMVARDGILSTPAASHIIRKYKAFGGLIVSASHNPGGIKGDFGIKYNIENGGPALEAFTQAVWERTKQIQHYKITPMPAIDLSHPHTLTHYNTIIEIFDPIKDYADLMESLFDFTAIQNLGQNGFNLCFDAMSAVTGPYAMEIFCNRLGFAPESLIHCTPLPDFGGHHPDPNPIYAIELMRRMSGQGACDFGAASDGDGDRNMILGRDFCVSPSDSLAILTAHAPLCPGYQQGIKGVARSMPTSEAVDRVAQCLNIPCFETPTGWKFFGNLLDRGLVSLCGEESFGTSSAHIREKDGLWAVLMWLNILAKTKKSVKQITLEHWRQFGRNLYMRYDFEGLDQSIADQIIQDLRQSSMVGHKFKQSLITQHDDFCYHDPVDGSMSEHQGIRLIFANGARIIYRLSGTGTSGATLRIYLEQYERDEPIYLQPIQTVLADLADFALKTCKIKAYTGNDRPTLIV